MDAAGVPIDPALISHGHVPRRGGDRPGPRAAASCPTRPTAIFAGNDLQALGVYQAARELRLHIPEDLSVVGFDDLPVARWVGPPLTTIRQPLVEMAETAAELVLALARGRGPPPRRASSWRPSSSSARAPGRRPPPDPGSGRQARATSGMPAGSPAGSHRSMRIAREELVDDQRRRRRSRRRADPATTAG